MCFRILSFFFGNDTARRRHSTTWYDSTAQRLALRGVFLFLPSNGFYMKYGAWNLRKRDDSRERKKGWLVGWAVRETD